MSVRVKKHLLHLQFESSTKTVIVVKSEKISKMYSFHLKPDVDSYRVSDFEIRLCKLIIRKSYNISHVKKKKKRRKSFGFKLRVSRLLSYSHIFPHDGLIKSSFSFCIGPKCAEVSLHHHKGVTDKLTTGQSFKKKEAINTHKHFIPNNSYWPNKVNLKDCMCSTSVTTRVTNTNRWRMTCTRLWLRHIKLVVSVQCDDQHASGWVGGWKQNLCREYWHDHHLACLKEVISVLMLSICASESSREGLTGLFMWLNSCSACYIANGGVEEGSWVGE